MTKTEYTECLEETLQELREDATLIELTLMGAQRAMDSLTLSCLQRLTDYLQQHVNDICVLCGGRHRPV